MPAFCAVLFMPSRRLIPSRMAERQGIANAEKGRIKSIPLGAYATSKCSLIQPMTIQSQSNSCDRGTSQNCSSGRSPRLTAAGLLAPHCSQDLEEGSRASSASQGWGLLAGALRQHRQGVAIPQSKVWPRTSDQTITKPQTGLRLNAPFEGRWRQLCCGATPHSSQALTTASSPLRDLANLPAGFTELQRSGAKVCTVWQALQSMRRDLLLQLLCSPW